MAWFPASSGLRASAERAIIAPSAMTSNLSSMRQQTCKTSNTPSSSQFSTLTTHTLPFRLFSFLSMPFSSTIQCRPEFTALKETRILDFTASLDYLQLALNEVGGGLNFFRVLFFGRQNSSMHGSRRAQWRSTLFNLDFFFLCITYPRFSFVLCIPRSVCRARVQSIGKLLIGACLWGDHSMVGNTVYIMNDF